MTGWGRARGRRFAIQSLCPNRRGALADKGTPTLCRAEAIFSTSRARAGGVLRKTQAAGPASPGTRLASLPRMPPASEAVVLPVRRQPRCGAASRRVAGLVARTGATDGTAGHVFDRF